MRRRFEAAIRQVGGVARLPGGTEFPASVQPLDTGGELLNEDGAGYLRNFRIYTVFSGVTAGIGDGDIIEYEGAGYFVRNIETVSFRGEGMFRQGILTRKEGL